MSDLVVIIPTKGRQHLLPRALEGIARATEPVDVVFVINEEDVEAHAAVIVSLQPTGSIRAIIWETVDNALAYPGKLNAGAERHAANYHFMALFNDDHEAMTPGWDVIAKNAIGDEWFGLAHGPDGVWEEGQVPTAPILTTTLQTVLGWVVLPGLFHIRADDVWRDLANWCGTNHFLPELRIQHHHLDNGGAEMDATYALTQNNHERNAYDNELFDKWWHEQRWVDGDRLRALWPEGTNPPRQFAPWE